MKPPRSRPSSAPPSPETPRHLAFVHMTNLSDIVAGYDDARRTTERFIETQLASFGCGPSDIVFLEGPYVLIDFARSLDVDSYNKDALCEHVNARFMAEPIACGSDGALLIVETMLLKRDEEYAQLLANRDVRGLTSKIKTALKLGDNSKRVQSYKADMASAVKLFSHLAAGTLTLAFQPIVSSSDRKEVIYWESLLRRRTNLSALELTTCADYITAADRLGMTDRLDRSLLWTHLDLLQKHPKIKLGCNISAQSLKLDGWWRVLFEELSRKPDVAKRLTIEITETQSITEDDEALLLLQTLRLLGCHTAIDAMGAGYSTLNFAFRICPDYIKLNEAYLALDSKRIAPHSGHIVKHLTQLCTHVSSCVIVKGIESDEDVSVALVRGADGLQGDFLAEPEMCPPWSDEPVVVRDASAPDHKSHRLSPFFPS